MNLGVVKDKYFIFTLFNVFLLISPGIAIIYRFNKDLFLQLDGIKLILMSVAIITPLIVVNTFLNAVWVDDEINNENSLFVSFTLSAMISAMLLYLIIFLDYLSYRNLKENLLGLGLAELFYMLIVSIYSLFKDKKVTSKN